MSVIERNGRAGIVVTSLALCAHLSACTGDVMTGPNGGTPPGTAAPPTTNPSPTNPNPSPTNPNPTTPSPTTPAPSFPVGTTPAGTVEECDVDALSGPAVYGNKVKTLLTGLPLTSEELTTLRTSATALPELIDQWMRTPEFERVLTQFFQTAFQQNQIDSDGLTTMIRKGNTRWGRFTRPNQDLDDLLVQNIRESFARTAMRIVDEGRPFSEVLTTDTFEMTTAMLVFHAFLEQRYVSDQNRLRQRGMSEVQSFTLYRNRADAPAPEETLDPSHRRFMHFYVTDFEDLCLPSDQTTYTVDESAFGGNDEMFFIFSAMMGRPERAFNREANRSRRGNPCRSGRNRATPLLSRSDFEDWRPVRFRPVQGDQEPSRFYDLGNLRQASQLRVRTERVGFFTTLGFFATWPTNEDNASRVTLNQTLITALGASFDGTTVADFSPPNLDAEHSAPGTACYGCHQTLDPMRDFFRRSYTFAYGLQDDEDRAQAMEPHFVFRGVQTTGSRVSDLASILARHPDFPRGWVQKMCFFANTAPCPEETEAFRQVVETFSSSNFDFSAMLRELLSSTLVTNTACVDGSTGHRRSISRRDQLCAQLSERLGVTDICGASLHPARRSRTQRDVAAAAISIPADTFARGEPDPVVIAQTGLFTRATREVVCTVVAERAYAEAFGDLERGAAIDRMVERVMGLPEGDARHDPAVAILTEHVRDGTAAGADERTALQSALVLACMSPGMAGVGF